MQIEQALYEYPYIKIRIEEIEKAIMDLEAQREAGVSCPLSRIGSAPQPAGRTGDPTAQAAILLCDYLDDRQDRLRVEHNQLQAIVRQVDLWMAAITARERSIIQLRYFQRRRWRDISNMVELSRRHTIRCRDQAISTMKGECHEL